MSHESFVDQQIKCTQNLPFEVIAVRHYDDSRIANSATNNLTDPVNVKIRIRNKEEIAKKHGIISAPKLAANSGRKVRLISSDQTIMSFDFFVEPDTDKKQQKKSHKNIFHIFRPGGCLKTQDTNDNDYHYSPSSFSDTNDIKDPSSTMEDPTNIIIEKNILKKNFPSISPTNAATKMTGNFMGKCKPGGCLDPPFNEDKYSYEPPTARSNASINNIIDGNKDALIREATMDSLNIISNIKINKQEISENIIRTQIDNNAYQENYSHSLITYSSSSTDTFQIYKQSNDTKSKKRISSEDKAKISINEFSEIYFMPPKKDNTKILEKESSENASEIENKIVFEDKKSKYSVTNHIQINSPTLTIDSSISLDSDAVKSQPNIKPHKTLSFENKSNVEVKRSTDGPHTFEDIKFASVAHSSVEYINKNIISSKNSTIALPDTGKPDKSLFRTKKTYSQEVISYNKNKTDTTIEINEVDKPILKNVQQLLEKGSLESNLLNEIKPPSVKNKDIQNINSNNIADPATKIKYGERSSKMPQESLKIQHEETDYVDNIELASLKSEEMQNKGKNITVFKHSEASFKKSQESITQKLEEISKRDKDEDTLSKSENKNTNNIDVNSSKLDMVLEAIESKSSLGKTQETLTKDPIEIFDKNEAIKTFITDIERAHLESNTSITYSFTEVEETALDDDMSKDQKERYFEKYLEPDSIFSGGYHIVPIEKHKSIDILTSEEDNYDAANPNFNKKNITDTYMTSYDNLNKLLASTPPETPTLKTSDVKFSLTSLIQDKTDETNPKSFDKDKNVNLTIKTHKYVSLSKSLISTIGSEKNIEVDSDEHFDELNNNKLSIVYNMFDQIKNQINELNDNTSSEISVSVIEDINDKHKFSINTTQDSNERITKKLQSPSLGNLDKNSFRNQPPIDSVNEETDVNSIVKTFDENRLDLSTYSSVTVDFGFRCSIDNENKLVIHTFDTTMPSYEDVKTKVSVIKSIIRINGDEIRIPINFDTDLLMQIKQAEVISKGIISNKEITPQQDLIVKSSDKTINKDTLLQETLNSVYENLIPINKIIQNLKEEANALSRQQTSLKEILATMEMKPKRMIHTNPLCGCENK